MSRSATATKLGFGARSNDRVPSVATPREASIFASNTSYLVALGLVLFFAAIVRLYFVMTTSFPLNDGGMFMQAIVDLQHSHFMLPQYIHYNGLPIPYAYPPLGFYVAGLVASATHASLFTVLRIVPAIFSVLTVVAFMKLADSYLGDRTTVVVASLAFSFVPRSFSWQIMGGGLTRSIGFFFGILAIWQAYLLFTQRSRRTLIWTTMFSSLACLSHLEMAWFVAFSAALLMLAYGRTRRGFLDAALVSAGVLILTSPWWGLVIERHGIEPFVYASHSGGHTIAVIVAYLLTLNWGQEQLFPLFGALALIGMLYCVVRRRYFLPVWVFTGLLLDPRKFETEAMVPMSMIVGICVVTMILPLIREGAATLQSTESVESVAVPSGGRTPGRHWIGPVAVGIVVIYAMLASMFATAIGDVPLSTDERQAMQWVSQSTSPNSRFAIINGDDWAVDRSSEWFPVLAGRTSVATVQGNEWLPNDAFGNQVTSSLTLQKCASETAACIDAWAVDEHATFNYVYIASRELEQGAIDSHVPCCSGLVESLENDPNYELVFQNDGAAIFERRSAVAHVDGMFTEANAPGRRQTPL
ncbi:MAG TPA: glycosyltransferase family 39 protein [Nitrolancea sp.]|nr:glycosyltransferase family 39 protein [Nitrolancea sp.]